MPTQTRRQEEYLENPLPHSEDAERVSLGAVILDNALIAHLVEELTEADYYHPLHKRVFTAMVELFNSSRPIDPVTIGDVISTGGSLEAIGGTPAITRLALGLPQFSDISEYIQIIKT